MTKQVRALLVEDSEDDAALMLRYLKKEGFAVEYQRVDCEDDLKQALKNDRWDIVITDHNLPGFSSDASIATVKKFNPDMPIIIVSGTIGEDLAVMAMRNGAQDYIMKNNLARLAPAVERELRETKNRIAHRRAQETIQHLALHDPLTGLSNRHDFESRLKNLLSNVGNGVSHALMYLDLDQFKIINDTCGHVVGDELLRQLAIVLREPIRETDMLARIGGDEFGILLANCSHESARQVGERLLQIMRQFRYNWKGRTFSIGGSIGLTMIEESGQSVSDVLRQADIACYAAKDAGRNRLQIYRSDDQDLMKRRDEMLWVQQIRQALEDNRFQLYRQNIASLASDPRRHSELLVRLLDEDERLVQPGSFIPAAERFGLMPELDRWVVRNALDYISNNSSNGKFNGKDVVFINLSGATLGDEDFCDFVLDSIKSYKINSASVGFEITETSVISNLSVAINFIERIKNFGCRVALDDFGTGLSTFSYLKAIPADYVKIDGSFIRDMMNDEMDAAIVDAINKICHVAGLKTIAEYVETTDVWNRLGNMGIDYVQGFAVHRPAPISAPESEFEIAPGPAASER
ncbi:MAG: EAL domain-containing protein [Acidiferrobacterales bacterium]